jgi:hypothetical protein
VTELNLGWAVAWRAWCGGVLLSAGGLSLIVAAFVALPGRDPSQRAFAVRQKRWLGRSRMWHYTLVLRTAGEVPDLELWREGSRYRYELGPLGFAGRRLDRALARSAAARYRGLTRG